MSEYKGKSKKDLVKTLVEKRDALQNFRFGISGGKAKNVKEGRTIRKEIARIQTELSAQMIAEKVEAPKAEVKKSSAPKKAKAAKK
ncbi:MAG: 50S ribosomal protein L29 [Patescibacteria group bacterium]